MPAANGVKPGRGLAKTNHLGDRRIRVLGQRARQKACKQDGSSAAVSAVTAIRRRSAALSRGGFLAPHVREPLGKGRMLVPLFEPAFETRKRDAERVGRSAPLSVFVVCISHRRIVPPRAPALKPTKLHDANGFFAVRSAVRRFHSAETGVDFVGQAFAPSSPPDMTDQLASHNRRSVSWRLGVCCDRRARYLACSRFNHKVLRQRRPH
jgi:hypothetical protein